MDWTTFGRTLVSGGSAAAIVGFLGKAGVDAWLKARLEAHKDKLQNESALALEQVKSELRIEEGRQSRLHGDVIQP